MGGMEKFWEPDLPVGWRHPHELDGPSTSPLTNLAIRMLSSDVVGNDIAESVGLVIAADARFSVWHGEGGGRKTPTLRELADLRVAGSEIFHGIYVAWKELEGLADGGDRVARHSAYQALLHELRKATIGYCAMMHETLGDFGNL